MAKHTTYVLEHPEARFDMVVSCASCMEVAGKLAEKLKEYPELPEFGWKVKIAHRDENSNPSMDQGVSYTDWDNLERCGL